MIPALLLGRKGSVGFPGKNTTKILGRALCEYPILAAKNSHYVDRIFLSTDDPKLKEIGLTHNIQIIDRPEFLCTNTALGEDAYKHGYETIKALNPDVEIQFMVLLFCNAPTLLASHIDKGIEVLRKDVTLDSAITVSQYNWYSPVRARKIGIDGLLEPFIPFESYPSNINIDCDRNTQGDVYFADVSVSVVRPRCLDNLQDGTLPQKWMGKRIHPIQNWGGIDVDKEWQMPLVEYWLRCHGFDEQKSPYCT